MKITAIIKKIILFQFILLFLLPAVIISAHQPDLVFLKKGDVQINNPELSQGFYDELKGSPRDYFIDLNKDFDLYLNLLVPAGSNPKGRYSAKVFLITGDPSTSSGQATEQEVAFIDGLTSNWQEYYEPFGRDYYLKGPEFDKHVSSGKYKIEVFSSDNQGKYVLVAGKNEAFDVKSLLNIYWQLPLLKLIFFKTSILQFFLTPFGIGLIAFIGAIVILITLMYFIVGAIRASIKHNQAKTLLLTSAGMAMKNEIIKLLQRPAYDVSVAFITTASKAVEDVSFVERDWDIMKELGFNVEEIDIEGKKEGEVMQLLKIKDIIFLKENYKARGIQFRAETLFIC